MDSTIYSTRIVLFLDILGFKELIRAGRETELMTALQIPKEIEAQSFHGARQMRLTAFSDSVVVSDEIAANPFGYVRLLQFASYLVWKFLQVGVLTRGGIAVGSLHHENGVVFGPALVDAYELESKQAIYPRILVPEDVRDAYVEEEVNQRGEQVRLLSNFLFRKDFDGALHLHILGEAAHSAVYPDKARDEAGFLSFTSHEILAAKADCLTQALARNQPTPIHPSAVAKHHWFKNYLAETLRMYGVT